MSHRLSVIFVATLLAGCASCPPPVEKPVFVPIPPQCMADCPYEGPTEIRINGQLLEAWKAREAQVTCYVGRLDCVRSIQP